METNQDNERYAGKHEGRSRRFDKQFFFQSPWCEVLALSEQCPELLKLFIPKYAHAISIY
jgi:hypothetical protein